MKTKTFGDLLAIVEALKHSDVGKCVESRTEEFRRRGNESSNEIFKELCFCILTANFSAERAIKIQMEIGDGFLTLKGDELAKKLRNLGYRFPSTRARYIVEAREYKDSLKEIFDSFDDEAALREWLVKSIKGIGYKEASHFLRNIGYKNLSILDFHIIDILVDHCLVVRPKTLSKKKYLEIEDMLKEVAKSTDVSLAELDLYLWCKETGKVLK